MPMKTPRFIQIYQDNAQAVQQELVQGLASNPAHGGATTSPKFLYDALGSRLFEAITELPEYYPHPDRGGHFPHPWRRDGAPDPEGCDPD